MLLFAKNSFDLLIIKYVVFVSDNSSKCGSFGGCKV